MRERERGGGGGYSKCLQVCLCMHVCVCVCVWRNGCGSIIESRDESDSHDLSSNHVMSPRFRCLRTEIQKFDDDHHVVLGKVSS